MLIPERQPVLYLSHGGGPCFWMDFPEPLGPHAFERLRDYLSGLLRSLTRRPKSIVIVSAHWEAEVPTVSICARPPMMFDYYGFPDHTYRLNYPASGNPELARRVTSLLEEAHISHAVDDSRGFDHGVFVPMLIVDPEADIPVVMMSLQKNLRADEHMALGKALEALRSEDVLIIGSGSSYHNLGAYFDGDGKASIAFDTWLVKTVTSGDIDERQALLARWQDAPYAHACHPRPEHLLPLMVASGAGGADVGRQSFSDRIGGKAMSCFAFGALPRA